VAVKYNGKKRTNKWCEDKMSFVVRIILGIIVAALTLYSMWE
jgi:hypothetical protein